jgi:GH24 family phage-related lysozyme (muramidase)
MTRAIAGVHPQNTLALRAREQFASVRRAVRQTQGILKHSRGFGAGHVRTSHIANAARPGQPAGCQASGERTSAGRSGPKKARRQRRIVSRSPSLDALRRRVVDDSL